MSYSYEAQKSELFTAQGAKILMNVKNAVDGGIKAAGAIRAEEAIKGCTGDAWTMMAALDFLCEPEEIREITGPGVWGQHRVFVRA